MVTRLEKVATDNGFDREVLRGVDWVGFASTQVPLRVWLTAPDERRFVVALSQLNVARVLVSEGAVSTDLCPAGAFGVVSVEDFPSLHRLVRRAFQLSRTVPDELLNEFERSVAGLPRSTDVERLVVQRVGQEVFRRGLIEYWEGRCAISGLGVADLLRASHIKPWADCDSDGERLDVFNGLLLAPHLDALFDKGFITLDDDGVVMCSGRLSPEDRQKLGLAERLNPVRLTSGHRRYLQYHRTHIFRDSVKAEVRVEVGPEGREIETEQSRTDGRGSMFDVFVGIDYSGADTPEARLSGLRVFSATPGAEAQEVLCPDGFRWTRRALAGWLTEQLSRRERVIVGIDHAFSFPLAYFDRHGLPKDWPSFLDDFCAHWPTDTEGVWVRDVRQGRVGLAAERSGEVDWFRATDRVAGGAKCVFRFGFQGEVATSTHAGLPWLRHLRQLVPAVHFWPFDGWAVRPGASVVAEVYPSLWRSSCLVPEGLSEDQRDACVVASWLRDAANSARLAECLAAPDRSDLAETGRVEGWILGAAPRVGPVTPAAKE